MREQVDPDKEATAKEIIEAIVDAMVLNLEPMHTKTLAPGLFHVYLREKDYNRLKGIFLELNREAVAALDEQIARLNKSTRRGLGPMLNRLASKFKPALENVPEEMRPSFTGKFKIEGECVKPRDNWQISFYRNEDPNSEPGDIEVEPMLVLPERPELGVGMTTKSIKTLYRAGSTRITGRSSSGKPDAGPAPPQRITMDAQPPRPPAAETLLDANKALPAASGPAKSSGAIAVLRYRDNDGEHVFEMTKPSVVVGRGGTGVWVDIKLNTLPDVSREHLRIKRDDASGRFYLKDISTLGTTIDGRAVPPAMETSGDKRIDKDVWVSLPKQSRIGLAGVLIMDFDAQ